MACCQMASSSAGFVIHAAQNMQFTTLFTQYHDFAVCKKGPQIKTRYGDPGEGAEKDQEQI